MALCLVLVLETIAAERTLVLLFSLVSVEFLNRLEPLGLLGATLAHEEALHFSSARLLHLSDLTCAGTRNGPRVN